MHHTVLQLAKTKQMSWVTTSWKAIKYDKGFEKLCGFFSSRFPGRKHWGDFLLRLPAIFWWKTGILWLEVLQEWVGRSLDTVQHCKACPVTLVSYCREANRASLLRGFWAAHVKQENCKGWLLKLEQLTLRNLWGLNLSPMSICSLNHCREISPTNALVSV